MIQTCLIQILVNKCFLWFVTSLPTITISFFFTRKSWTGEFPTWKADQKCDADDQAFDQQCKTGSTPTLESGRRIWCPYRFGYRGWYHSLTLHEMIHLQPSDYLILNGRNRAKDFGPKLKNSNIPRLHLHVYQRIDSQNF